MKWLNFLHLYQPASTEFYNIKEALDKSYWRLIRLLEEHPNLKMTFNISGCLLERLIDAGENEFISRLQKLVKAKQLELVGSAYYHGLLPLLPEAEIVYQIKANEKILNQVFGENFKPIGFFLPEMAYSPAISKIIKKLGYKWLILDEITFSGLGKKKPQIDKLYIDSASSLKVIFRQRDISNTYPPDSLRKILNRKKYQDKVFLTATDAELYGLRHEDPTAELEKIVKQKEISTDTISCYINLLKGEPIKVRLFSSSWESSVQEIKDKNYYSLWQNKRNKIQVELWSLTGLALSLDKKYKKDKNYYWYRWHLSRGLASCTFWWASAHDFSKSFGPYAWNPDLIERGLNDLIRSVRSLNSYQTREIKLLAERQYLKIKKLIWEEHWQNKW